MSDLSRSRFSGFRLPLFLSLALAVGIALCAAALWQREKAASARAAEQLTDQEQRNAALEAEKARLQKLLEGEPCSAARALGLSEALPAPASPQSASAASAATTASERVENATVLVLNILRNGDLGVGSGFFVAPGVVVTNRHVVAGESRRLLVVNKALGGPAEAAPMALSDDADRDYAVLKVRSPEGAAVGALALRGGAKRTEKVSAWGFPTAVSSGDPKFQALLDGSATSIPEVVYAEGVISVVLDRNPPLLAHTAPLSPGNSGGPLVDAQGRVVGINTMITLDDESYRQTSLSPAAEDLNAFLRRSGVRTVYTAP